MKPNSIKTIFAVLISGFVSTSCAGVQESYSPGKEFTDCTGCPTMVVVPAGSFIMGPPTSFPSFSQGDGPLRQETISQNFAVGKFEVTVAQYASFVSATGRASGGGCYLWTGSDWKEEASRSWSNPGFTQSDQHPVVCVNWEDADSYVSWLSGKTGRTYRLLSETEWEYSARAGTTTAYHWGNDINHERANYGTDECCEGLASGKDQWVNTAPAGSFAANAFGLYDMHGNVWEWAADCWNASYEGAPSGGSAWSTGDCSKRVSRGGSWNYSPRVLRSAHRGRSDSASRSHIFGFRVARTLN
jgi:formylglycine-generating enzyme required for sulfatase activity